jgi:hypothetical protein
MSRLFPPEDPVIGGIHDQLAHLGKIKQALPPSLGAGAEAILTREQLSSLIDTAFLASLRFNEGRATRFCVSVVAPENSQDAVKFTTPAPYDESQIAKLAPAIPNGGCLLVSTSDDGLRIWGFGHSRPGTWADTVTIDIWEPGTVRVGVGPFRPFAVLDGRANPSIIAGTPIDLADYLRRTLSKTLPAEDILETQAVWRECLALRDLAQMISADGHGGIVLIVPGETGTWSNSLLPFAYRFASADTRIRDAIRRELNEVQKQGEDLQQLSATELEDGLKSSIMFAMISPRQNDIARNIQAVASLAGVDGAIVITRDLQLLGFGAKIAVRNKKPPQVCMFRPGPGNQDIGLSKLEDLGGTRHQSAARFAAANVDTAAIVVSQDRHISVMHWDSSIKSVKVLRNAEWWV